MSVDLKRILAYSTVSQLSYMFLALGLAFAIEDNALLSTDAFYATQLHLLAHARIKGQKIQEMIGICHSYVS